VLSVPAGYELPKNRPTSISVTTDDPVAGSLRVPISAGAPARDIARPAGSSTSVSDIHRSAPLAEAIPRSHMNGFRFFGLKDAS
jgi:hypothetical protein